MLRMVRAYITWMEIIYYLLQAEQNRTDRVGNTHAGIPIRMNDACLQAAQSDDACMCTPMHDARNERTGRQASIHAHAMK